jgi:hypothetical protein
MNELRQEAELSAPTAKSVGFPSNGSSSVHAGRGQHVESYVMDARHIVCERLLCCAALLCMALVANTRADTFVYLDEDGTQQEVEARLAGSGQGWHALELADGTLRVVPTAAVRSRTPGDGPGPIAASEMSERLVQQFGAERTLAHDESGVVVCLVLAGKKGGEREVALTTKLIRQAARFLKSMQGQFLGFIRQTRIPAQPVVYPLVAVIFEADADFEKYAAEVTGNQGLSPGKLAGFYSSVSNYLVLRARECTSFMVPLHEGIHQQTFNRGILQRLAPIPTWFGEGLATGFEGDGERVRSGPTTVSAMYATLALRAKQVSWKEIVMRDRAFRGDVFAGEAYGQAWGMHWLLVTRYKSEYIKYVQLLAQKPPLAEYTSEQRLDDFEQIMGKVVGDMESEFYEQVTLMLRRMRVSVREPAVDSTRSIALVDRIADYFDPESAPRLSLETLSK